ncbi:MAG TPA: hypothetical protein VG476_04900, partial [Acidimicrobiales bacterium]|nr:hypothetical protein [Acidimicrobiales bacterium]
MSPSPLLTTTARATGPLGPAWLCGTVVLVAGAAPCGAEVVVCGAVVVCGTVVLVGGTPVVVVVGRGTVVGGVVVVAPVVEVVGDDVAVSAAASLPTPPTIANELSQPARTSAMVSPRTAGR